jgi:hypothetical protein
MKTKLLAALGIVQFFCLPIPARETDPVNTVRKVVISSGIVLEIERSQEYSLTVKTSDMDTSCLVRTIENGVLTLKLSSILECSGKVTARLCCPSISELEIMGNAEVSTFNVLKTDTLRIVQRSGGKAYLDLDVVYLDTNLSEGSLLTAKGYANTQMIKVNTNATCSAFELEGDVVDIQTSFGGKGKVCATEKLKALANMGGYIIYSCNPKSIEIDKKGNGKVEELAE